MEPVDKDLVIGRLYSQLLEKEQQLLMTIQALVALKQGSATLDQLEVSDTAWTIHPKAPEAAPKVNRGKRSDPPIDVEPTPLRGE